METLYQYLELIWEHYADIITKKADLWKSLLSNCYAELSTVILLIHVYNLFFNFLFSCVVVNETNSS